MRFFFFSYAYEKGLRADAGGFRKLWELAWALKKLGHEVQIFYPDLPGFSPLRDVPSRPYTVLDFPVVRPLTAYLAQVACAAAIGLRDRPDVLYVRSGINVLPLLLKHVLGAKLVLEVNADTLGFLQSEGAGAVSQWLFRLAEGTNARGCDRIVALTHGLKEMLLRRYGVPAAKVWVIPSGTDPAHFTPEEPAVARRRIGLSPDRPVVGFVGLFYRHQGVPTLLEAIAQLRSTVPGLSGLIVGDGVMRQDWEAVAHRLGIEKSVRFVGQVPYDEIPAYLNAMDVVVAPFTADRGETSPFKVLDAMACRRPVVASDLPSVKEVAENSGAIVLVPPDDPVPLADEVRRLLADSERRADMGRRGRVFVCAHHDWNRIGAQMVAILDRPSNEERPVPLPLISILIPAFNSETFLPACLASVEGLRYPRNRLEVVLVDDGSVDATRMCIERWVDRQAGVGWHAVKAVWNGRNLGASGARNEGLRRLDPDSEFVFSLDSDAETSPDALDHLLATGLSPSVGVVGGRIAHYHNTGLLAHAAGFVRRWAWQYIERYPSNRMDCDYVLTCGCLMRRRVVEAVGGFDPDFFVYHEDTDMCLQIKRLGYRIVYEPHALIVHRQTPRSSAVLYYLIRNKYLLAKKHQPLLPRAWSYFLLTVLGAPKMAGGALALHAPSMRDELWSIVRGVWDGLRGRGGAMVKQ